MDLENHMVLGNKDAPDVAEEEIEEASDALLAVMFQKGEQPKLIDRCWNYVEECSVDHWDAIEFFVNTLDPEQEDTEICRKMRRIANRYFREFVEENLTEIQQHFHIGPYRESDDE